MGDLSAIPQGAVRILTFYYILLKELAREGLCNQVVCGGCVGGLGNLICSREIKENTTTGTRSAPVGRGRRPRLCFLYFPYYK